MSSSEFVLWAGLFQLETEEEKAAMEKAKRGR